MTDREEDFIETLVRWGGRLGMNPVRLRWRLRRLSANWHEWRSSLASDNTRGYQHRVCGNCGSLQDRSARVCTQCGEKLGARSVERMHRLGFVAPRLSMSAGLGLLITLAYFRLILDARELGFGVLFTMDPHVLWVHGSWHMGAFLAGQYWRIVTALFLHIGLWHAGFNLLALATVGPAIEDLYGRGVTLFLFLLTGAIANLVSGFMSPYGNAGASGALMGLIGLAAVRGHLMRSAHGRQVRDLMLSWFVYTMLFGLLMHADNWAHAGGFVAGLAIGFVLEPRWLRHPVGRVVSRVLGGVGLVVTLAAMALVMWPPGAA